MKKNYTISIEYDGTEFVGWQRQQNGRSVQKVIEHALETIAGESVAVTGAGRTDSGVHARGQVANFHSETSMTCEELYRALNGLLPDDVVIHSVDEADETFSARFSAKEREYRYYICRSRTALLRKYSWRVGYALDVPLMNRVSGTIVGTHEFQAFCKAESSMHHYRCTVSAAQWKEEDGMLIFTIRANRFLHGMVRALVGTMVDVGRGYTSESDFAAIIASKNRSNAGQSAPPQGLFLERVIY
jgi:tRNA pseudouridine38-40 synthase